MPLFRQADVRTAWFQKLPSKLRKHQLLTIPRQWHFGHMKLKGYDIVISCSGAEAKAVRNLDGIHINYCHSPTQYYWVRPDEYLKQDSVGLLSPLYRFGLKILMPYAKKWDLKAAQRPDVYIANSSVVQTRIKKIYGRESVLIHPPVETSRFSHLKSAKPQSRKQRSGFLIAGRQVHHKRFDLTISACNELELPLTVVGNGPDHERLKKMAGPTVSFKQNVDDLELSRLMNSAEAFVFPNEEDFGIVAVEAQAAGCPVIAYRAGGALDTVKENITGIFFDSQSLEGLKNALLDFRARRFSEDRIRHHAEQFDEAVFVSNMKKLIENCLKNSHEK